MTNFSEMRENMILGQFLPGLIKDETLINIFSAMPREEFLEEQYKQLAYSDSNINIKKNRSLMSPFSAAKLIQTCNLLQSEIVLLIGSNIGYESAIVANLVDTVIAIEEEKDLFLKAENNFKNMNIDNVVNINSEHSLGHNKNAPYDAIIILGSINKVDAKILDQLIEGGRLLVCESFNNNIIESKLYKYYKRKNKFIKNELYDLNLPKLNFGTSENTLFKLS